MSESNGQEDKLVPRRAKALETVVSLVPHDDEGVKRYPTVMDLLLPLYDSKGRVCRLPGSLSVRCEGAVFKCIVSCPSEGLTTILAVDSIADLFKRLESHLASGKAVWVPDWNSQKRARRDLDSTVK